MNTAGQIALWDPTPATRIPRGPTGPTGQASREQDHAPSSPQRTTTRQHTLWLCLHLPDLSLEVHAGYEPDEPMAVTETHGQQIRIHAASPAARARGVYPGTSRSAAQALCPELRLEAREVRAEAKRLDWLAAWAGRWSSWVSVRRPDILLLEIAGSRRLFGGVEALHATITAQLAGHGHHARSAIACSARAASWLAPWAAGTVALTADATRQAISQLPVAAVGVSSAQQLRLHRAGLQSVNQLLRLPRDGLARRYGRQLLAALDEACGRSPEALPAFSSPERFAADLELVQPESATPRLMAACEHLVQQLVDYLRAHHATVDRVQVSLFHEHVPASTLTVGHCTAGRDAKRLLHVLGEHLDRLPLPEPVRAIRLHAPSIHAYAPATRNWLDGRNEDAWMATLERWQARLGHDAVVTLAVHADHRPEQAWSVQPAPQRAPSADAPATPRPVWLLNPPQPLDVIDQRPTCDGPLTVETGPERIEQGWWDNGGHTTRDISRDYYVMRTSHGERLWVFQDRQRLGWWLHGRF